MSEQQAVDTTVTAEQAAAAQAAGETISELENGTVSDPTPEELAAAEKAAEENEEEENLSKGVAKRINDLQEKHQAELAELQAANEERDKELEELRSRVEVAEKAEAAAARNAEVLQLSQKHAVSSSLLSRSGLSGKELEVYAKDLAAEIKTAASSAGDKIQQAALGAGAGANSGDPIKEGLRIIAERKAKGKK